MRRLLRFAFSRIVRHGSLRVTTASGHAFRVGDGTGEEIAVRFTDAAAERAIILNPELRLGEMYMEGRFIVESGSIYDLIGLAMRNVPNGNRREPPPFGALRIASRGMARLVRRNYVLRARRNAAHHYDLDARLYDLFLDEDRQYSCAYFERPGMSLDEAQRAKERHITAKLLVEPGMSVLDIGCGWGGLALYLAGVARAGRVTGITLSHEQFVAAHGRAKAAGLDDRVDIALSDYRDVAGRFDRIVSVGMFEHVGPAHYDTFFRTCAERLKNDGVLLLHTIGATGEPGPTNPWITRYIFPGGHIPTLSEIMPAIERAGLVLADLEVLRIHYADTLRHWRNRFMARRAEAAALYDERFCRMWEFYLSAAEASFRYEDLVVFQFQLARRKDAVPITRDYLAAREHGLRMMESAPDAAANRNRRSA